MDKSLFHNRRTQLPNPTSVGQWLVLTHSPSPACPWKQTPLLPRLKSMHSCVSCTFSQQSKSVKLCKTIMVSLHDQQHVGFQRHGDRNNSVFQFSGLWGNGKLSLWTWPNKRHPCKCTLFACETCLPCQHWCLLMKLLTEATVDRKQLERCWWSQLIKCSMKVHLQDRNSC